MSNTSRRKFLQTSVTAAAASMFPSSAITQDRTRKNVLFIGIDDLNTSLGCYGNPTVQTPNVDRLARHGVRFDAAYCQYPLCGPSRSSLMTGLSPDTTHVYDLKTHFREALPNVVTLGQLFRKNGYYSARVGKIYHAGNPGDIGTDGLDDPQTWDWVYDPCGVDHLKEEPLVTKLTPHRRGLGSSLAYYASPAKDDEITDGIGANEVIRLLQQHRSGPFFIAYGLYRPHVPWVVPAPYFAQYPLEKIQAVPFDPAELQIAPPPAYWTQPPNFGMNELDRRKAIQGYYAATSFMDAQIGKVLTALETLGLSDNTIIVLWADHGWQMGQHGQWMKQTLFEHAARVPVIFAGPGILKHGATCHRTTEHLDIYPTLAELCNLAGTPDNLHGESLVPLLKNPEAAWSKPAITQVERPATENPRLSGYSVRTERYRYTSWQDGYAGEELYDYQNDPHEMKNLASDPRMHRIKATLQTQLDTISVARGKRDRITTA
ncbi:MAG: sulfatase [Acidobacteriaceae bacterium]